MTNCPPSLRGDLSKWLCEINTGVYVGNVSSRVRDAIWDRVCENLKNGQATLVFNTNNEQRMDFRTHNTSWEAVDFEGIKLMRRPLPRTQAPAADLKPGFSNAAKRQMAQKMARKKAAALAKEESYTVIDLETTGLNAASDANTALSVCGMVSLPKNFRPLSGAQNLCRMWWQSSPASRRRSGAAVWSRWPRWRRFSHSWAKTRWWAIT